VTRTPPRVAIVALIGALVAIYSVSQFLRNSIGVIASDLARELGLSATELGLLSSAFFLAFALAQIPVGVAIDRYGPKRTLVATAAICIAGTALFAAAESALALIAARAVMGLGCASFLMAPLAIYARRFAPDRFAFLTSLQLGFASLGTLFATAPLASAAATIGWRAAFAAVAALTAMLALLAVVALPADKAAAARESWSAALRGVAAALRVPSFWPVFVAHGTAYATFATIIGLWAGPWLSDVHGAELELRGRLLLIGAATQIAGLFAWGFSDRFFRSYRRTVLIGASLAIGLLLVAAFARMSLFGAGVWLALFGFAAGYTPMLMAHGKQLFPGELTGRGITLMNVATMTGVFVFQSATGALVDLIRAAHGSRSEAAYRAVFLVLALGSAASLLAYARSRDPHPSR
jgi:predicted MFS family arabinose efflux permease